MLWASLCKINRVNLKTLLIMNNKRIETGVEMRRLIVKLQEN